MNNLPIYYSENNSSINNSPLCFVFIFQSNYLIHSHGSQNVGEVVRAGLKALMTDELMLKYNRTGRKSTAANPEAKLAIPESLRSALITAASHFHPNPQELKLSRSGKDFTCTVAKEVDSQMEIYLSNTRARIARAQRRKDRLATTLAVSIDRAVEIATNETTKETTVATPPLPDLGPALGGDEMLDDMTR